MKKNIILSFCFLLALSSFGQVVGEPEVPAKQSKEHSKKHSEEKRKEIEAQRVAYITTQLELTPEESAEFWPVYNQYKTEMGAHQKANKGKKAKQIDTQKLSDNEINELVKARFAHERAKVDIEEKYFDEFKKVLPTKKVAAFYKANDDFRKELLRSLRGRASMDREEAEHHRYRAQREMHRAERELKQAKQVLSEESENMD